MMHAHASYGASQSAESMQVRLFPRRKAGELGNSPPRGRAPLKVDRHAIQSLFDRPEGEAAKQIGISITAMKQLCRKLGIERWPYRRQKKEKSARAAARNTCSSVCASAIDNSMDTFEPAQTPHSEVSSVSTRAGSSQRVDSQSPAGQDGFSATSSPPPSPPGNCGAYLRLSADRLSCHMADLDMAQARKISPLETVVRPPTAGPTSPQPVPPRSNAYWILSPCVHRCQENRQRGGPHRPTKSEAGDDDHQGPSMAHHEARARPRAADAVKQAALQVAAYVKEYGDPSYCLYSDAAGPQQLPGHLAFREDVADSEEDDDLEWLVFFEKSNPYSA